MVAAAKASVPTIQDQASAMQLSQCAKNLGTALAELRTAAQKVWQPSLAVGQKEGAAQNAWAGGEARQSSL